MIQGSTEQVPLSIDVFKSELQQIICSTKLILYREHKDAYDCNLTVITVKVNVLEDCLYAYDAQ